METCFYPTAKPHFSEGLSFQKNSDLTDMTESFWCSNPTKLWLFHDVNHVFIIKCTIKGKNLQGECVFSGKKRPTEQFALFYNL